MIIINPNNLSPDATGLSGSFSGSMTGRMHSYTNTNKVVGSFNGQLIGEGSGSFLASEDQGHTFRGDGINVNQVFHFISSS